MPPAAFWGAIVTVVGAYLVVCLDNVMAIAAIGKGHPFLITIGLALSCALMIPGSLVVANLMRRYPMLVFVGAGVLGWTAGTLFASDRLVRSALHNVAGGSFESTSQLLTPSMFAVLIVISPLWYHRWSLNLRNPSPLKADGDEP